MTTFLDYKAILKCEKGTIEITSYIDTDYGTKEEQEKEISSIEYWKEEKKHIDVENKYGDVLSVEIIWK